MPEPFPPPCVEKLSSRKPVPDANKVGAHCSRAHAAHTLLTGRGRGFFAARESALLGRKGAEFSQSRRLCYSNWRFHCRCCVSVHVPPASILPWASSEMLLNTVPELKWPGSPCSPITGLKGQLRGFCTGFPMSEWDWTKAQRVLLFSQFSCSVVSDSLRPHESQHARPPCPSPTPGVYSNSCPSSRWCHPAISPSVGPFSSCPQSLPASGSFATSQLFAWGGQSIGVSASASVLPMNTEDSSPSGWTGWISMQFKGFSRVFSNTTVQKHQFFGTQLSSQSDSHIRTWPPEKP